MRRFGLPPRAHYRGRSTNVVCVGRGGRRSELLGRDLLDTAVDAALAS